MKIVQIKKRNAVNVFNQYSNPQSKWLAVNQKMSLDPHHNIKNERECHEKGIQLSNLAADQKNVKTVVGRWLGSNPSPPGLRYTTLLVAMGSLSYLNIVEINNAHLFSAW